MTVCHDLRRHLVTVAQKAYAMRERLRRCLTPFPLLSGTRDRIEGI